jgi:exo-beta-1,3-glucanase (GH17 family)
MTRPALLFALVAAAIGLAWYALGRPEPMPPSPLAPGEKLNCLSYAPFQGEQAPFSNPLEISDAQIAADLERLSKVTSCVRTYSASNAQGRVTTLAGRYGLTVLQGIWLGRDLAQNRKEIEQALLLVRGNPGVIQALVVGNEVLLRGELSASQIKTYLEEVRTRSGLPVTYADVWEFWLKKPELASSVDFVTIHILPYWEDKPVTAAKAVQHVREIRNAQIKTFGGKEILIGEMGWPSEGRMREGALPSPANQALVLSGVAAAAKAEGWKVNFIEAFDQPWKRLLEGTVGGYWGLFDATTRAPKFGWGQPVSNHPRWQLEAELGIGVALIVFVAGWLGRRDRRTREVWGPDLAVAAIALSSGLVFGWAVVNFLMERPDFGDRISALGMLALALAVPMTGAVAAARGSPFENFATALNPPLWRGSDRVSLLLSWLFVATVVAAVHAALGLVFDPRYQDFPFAALSGSVLVLAIMAFVRRSKQPRPGVAETAAAFLLTGSALFILINEGIANWQALWFAGLLVLLSLTALTTERPGQG